MYDNIFSTDDMIHLQDYLWKNNLTITTAESCTGGLVASLITKISGSSDIFDGSIVSYSNKIKNQELNVSNKTLEKYGAVSKEVVKEMLVGVKKKFNSSLAIAISGIAGPNGGTKLKPVGTVIIGIIDQNNNKIVETYIFKGNRENVQIQAANTSLKKILNLFLKTLDK